jgi:hypothetical protein
MGILLSLKSDFFEDVPPILKNILKDIYLKHARKVMVGNLNEPGVVHFYL